MDHCDPTCITKKCLMEKLAPYPDDFPIFFRLKTDDDVYQFTGYVFVGPGYFNSLDETATHFHITLEDKRMSMSVPE